MKAKQGFKLRPLGNEFILVGESIEQINFNKMITMNETAAYLWKKVADGTDFDAKRLADYLLEEYEVSEEQALQDAQNTCEAWQNAGIIE
ncbi:MAG: PqqD family protein [Paludibacteraceae bacterium]|nr:PqqD family protein [Paludibacteraceae bacterium]